MKKGVDKFGGFVRNILVIKLTENLRNACKIRREGVKGKSYPEVVTRIGNNLGI
jgi:5-methylthioribose kinase